jgi:hypothetical protein
MEEALKRAHAYVDAGADTILIHSKSQSPDEIFEFVDKWNNRAPLVVVPTKYYKVTAEELQEKRISMVIYKPALYESNEIKNIFETYVDEVIIERFEDVYNHADCLVYSSPYSTTFGFSLLSNKPIVLLNVQGYTWYPRVLELIRKRCSVVRADAADGRIVFDEKELVKAVELSLNNIDYEILYEFAF